MLLPSIHQGFFGSRLAHTSSSSSLKSGVHLTVHSLLERCSTLEHVHQLHARIVTGGLLEDNLTAGKLIAVCAISSAGNLDYARKVFDRIPVPNRFMWNSMIRGYVNRHDPRQALGLYRQMVGLGHFPNDFTLPFVLKACAAELALMEGVVIHGQVMKLGFGEQVFVQNALLHVYAVCGSIACARRVFDETPEKSLVSWNSMIGAYSRAGFYGEAFELFQAMRGCGLEPDTFTFVNLLSVCSQTRNYDFGRKLHLFIEVYGVNTDLFVRNALLDMYAKNGDLVSMKVLFDKMPDRNVVSWTSMINAYAKHGFLDLARHHFELIPRKNVVSWNCMISCYVHHGLCREALDVYIIMQTLKEEPDETTLVNALAACSQIGDLVMGKKIHSYISNGNLNPSVTLYNALIDMYGKCGLLQLSYDLFNWMPKKNVVSWNVMIGALAIHGRAEDAIYLLTSMTAGGFTPDAITFVGILSACSHAGFLDNGHYYFESMNRVYGVPHEIEHFACMIDLLGRVGHLKEAVQLIGHMPMKPDAIIWGSLLGACRIHINVDVGIQVLRQLLELESCSGGLYVLISNMFCEANRWEDMKIVRKLMNEKGIMKEKALSSIEVYGNVHEFLVEDKRHEVSSDIYSMLDGLTNHMRSLGNLLNLCSFW